MQGADAVSLEALLESHEDLIDARVRTDFHASAAGFSHQLRKFLVVSDGVRIAGPGDVEVTANHLLTHGFGVLRRQIEDRVDDEDVTQMMHVTRLDEFVHHLPWVALANRAPFDHRVGAVVAA